MQLMEINFDGLVGPTHNYAGLSLGNVASTSHKGMASNPRKAALQGLAKAKALAERGFPQAVLPPHERPALRALREWGFTGRTEADVLEKAAREAPALLAAACSASAMWTANAFTMTPSCDASDERVHFTPANLASKLHRSIEPPFTTRLLRSVFADEERFLVHDPLPASDALADEGAANHTRLCGQGTAAGLHLFVHGRSALQNAQLQPQRFPARQTLESFQAISRHHRIPEGQALFLRQSPKAIDAGVFHNDVISVGSGNLLLVHEMAYEDQASTLQAVKETFSTLSGGPLHLITVTSGQVALDEAVRTYLFNSQLLQRPGGGFLIVVPSECQASPKVSSLIDTWLTDTTNPINEVLAFDLRESMQNGGGPACLRNRVLLSNNELRHLRGRLLLDDALHADLQAWINRHYRESVKAADLADPLLMEESRAALDELSTILHLPGLYDFQR